MKLLSTVLTLSLLSGTAIGTIFTVPAYAQSNVKNVHEEQVYLNDLQKINTRSEVSTSQKVKKDNRLKPRIELNHRYSNDRAITMSEFWVPLAQNEIDGSVLFGDVRIMGDNNSNNEYNAGIGYREIVNSKLLGEGVAGGMVWLDRRHTARGSKFNQITTGLEWLGEQYDVRLNGYVPLNNNKTHTQANPNGSGLGFVGNQILVNTDQSVVEEALPGLDLELGYKLDFMDGVTDSTRVYGGAYHFQGDRAENVTGVRARIASDITSDIQVGARYQHDDVRGSQTYLEATVRFPFKSKKSFKREGLRSRLDEAPERDIDIVSNEAVTDDGISQAILNVNTGTTQNVVHVDNTAAGGGDGSIETPYNTLAVAEGVAVANDLIYVHRGDGTTAGQANGITLDDEGQMLVGTGVNLAYDTSRFRTPNGLNVTNGVLAYTTTTAPVITNGAGSGVDVTADNAFISGVTVDGATNFGVNIMSADNSIIDSVTTLNSTNENVRIEANTVPLNKTTVRNSVANNSALADGFLAYAVNGGSIGIVNFENNMALNNAGDGLIAYANVGSLIDKVNIKNNISNNNGGAGLFAFARGNIGELSIENNTSMNNAQSGFFVESLGVGSAINSVSILNNTASGNTQRGFYLYAFSGGDLGTTSFVNNTAKSNTLSGFLVQSQDVGSSIDVSFTDNLADTNNVVGFYAYALNGGIIGETNFIGNTAQNNISDGFIAQATTGGSILDVSFTNNFADNNSNHGFYTYALSGGVIGRAGYTDNMAQNSSRNGFYAQANGVGSTITSTDYINNLSNSNTFDGFFTSADFGGDIGILSLDSNTSTGNASSGFSSNTNGAGSSITSTIFSNNVADNNDLRGFYSLAQNDGDVGSLTFINNISTNNTQDGFQVQVADTGSTITSVSFKNNIADNNDDHSFYAYAVNDGDFGSVSFEDNVAINSITGFWVFSSAAGSNINSTNLTNNIADDNDDHGFLIYSFNGGAINTANLINNSANRNGNMGFYTLSNGFGSTINSAVFTNNTASDNDLNGFLVLALSDADIAASNFEKNTSINNAIYGIRINDGSAGGVLNADLGGGVFGSTGGNSIYNNTLEEIVVDLDGTELKAENNWWGTSAGLLPAEVLLQDGSTVDTDPFLTVAP